MILSACFLLGILGFKLIINATTIRISFLEKETRSLQKSIDYQTLIDDDIDYDFVSLD